MNKVIIYTSSYCPYCKRAKGLLDSKGVDYTEINLTDSPDERFELIKKHNWRTVPMILINDKLIGGFDELAGLERSKELDKILSNPN
ncbi:MAG: glutaredoxin 3 [Thermodesulfobacteriota bacterium]